ncbi:MAG: hypothetical protein OSA08_14195, partial [Arenicellales bacterium]|nr:hypothetical protein [Arenicellales bacterium]
MVTFPNKKHRLLMVKLKYPFSRSITSLLSLTLVSAVLMLGSPAFAHELSGSTCAADVVFLWDKKLFAGCGLHGGLVNPRKGKTGGNKWEGTNYCGGAASMVRKPDDPAADEHGRVAVGKRPPLLYEHTKAVIDALSATGADVRFGTAEQSIDPAVMLAAGNYGNVQHDYMTLSGTPGGDFSDSTREGRERIAHAEEIEQQLFAAQTIDSQVFRYHNPKGLSAAEHNTAAKNAVGKFGKPDHTFGDQSRGGYNSHHQLDNRPPNAEGVAKDTRTFTENVFGRMGPNGIAFDSKGNAYVLNAGRNEVYKMSHLGAVMA